MSSYGGFGIGNSEMESGNDSTEDRGYFLEANVFPGTGRPRDFHFSVDEWMQDTSYSEFPNAAIASLFNVYDTDPSIRTAATIYQAALFSGGIEFERPDAQLSEKANRWYSGTWTKWASDVDRHMTCLRWCATSYMPHREYVGEPCVLDLSKCFILYKLDLYKQPHFVFFERMTMSLHSWALRYIENVTVYVDEAPDRYMNMYSIISVLTDDIKMRKIIQETTITALAKRANPIVVVETSKEAHDPEAIISTISPLINLASSSYNSSSNGYDDNPEQYDRRKRAHQEAVEQKAYAYTKAVSLIGTGGLQRIERLAEREVSAAVNKGVQEHALQEGKKASGATTQAEGGYDLLIAHRQAVTERAFNLFGIPMGMISQTSAFGDSTSMNENAYTVFLYTQKMKKTQLVNVMFDMYYRIYRVHHTMEKLNKKQTNTQSYNTAGATNNKRLKTQSEDTESVYEDIESMKHDVGINIRMTGLPDLSALTVLYDKGILKEEAYKKYAGAAHSLEKNDFNDESLQQRNDNSIDINQAQELMANGMLEKSGFKNNLLKRVSGLNHSDVKTDNFISREQLREQKIDLKPVKAEKNKV